MFRRQFWVAAAMFLVLAAAAVWVLRPGAPRETGAFFALGRAIPDTLVVAYEDTTVMVPALTGWRIIRPVRDLADPVAVDGLLKRLRAFEVDRTLPHDPSQEVAYGLRPPTCRIIARYREAPPETLDIGYPNAASPRIYVRRGTRGDVGLVAKRVPETYLLKNAAGWRSPFLLQVHESEITAFGFDQSVSGPVRVGRDPDGAWWVKRPYPGPADDDYVFEVLKTFSHLEILAYRDRNPPALADPLVAWVRTAAGDSVWIALGPSIAPDSALARVPERAATLVVPGKYRGFFTQHADAFRDTRILRLGWAEVDSLVLEPPGLHLTREQWGANPKGDIRLGALEGLLKLRAEGFLEATPERRERLASARGDLRLYGAEGLLVGMRFAPWGVSQVAFWLDRGPAARPGEIFLFSPSAVEPLWEAFRKSRS